MTTVGTSGNVSDLRARRRRATRREITSVALGLVLERGLADVTVEDIARGAGVSPRTFFNYFPSKKSAVLPVPEPLPAEVVDRFAADRESCVMEGLLTLLQEHLDFWAESRHELERTHRVLLAHPELIPVLHERCGEFEKQLTEALARRLDTSPEDRRPHVAATVVGALLRRAVAQPAAAGACTEALSEEFVASFKALRDLFSG